MSTAIEDQLMKKIEQRIGCGNRKGLCQQNYSTFSERFMVLALGQFVLIGWQAGYQMKIDYF